MSNIDISQELKNIQSEMQQLIESYEVASPYKTKITDWLVRG